MSSSHDQLLVSAKFFAAESISNALDAHENDPSRWPLALLHVVTSLEHAAKSLLAQQHPVFIRDRLDSDDRTVGLHDAIKRLQIREIYGLNLSPKDRTRIESAVKIRNGIAHGLGATNNQAAEAKFFEIFAYLRDFFRFNLGIKIYDLVEPSTAQNLLSIGKQIREMEKRALDSIDEEAATWRCPECSKEFMAEGEENFFCHFCHWEEPLFACEKCKISIPEHETLETNELFDWEFSEGRASLVTDYGITEKKVCETCFETLEEETEELKREYEIWAAEEEYQYYMERSLYKDRY